MQQIDKAESAGGTPLDIVPCLEYFRIT